MKDHRLFNLNTAIVLVTLSCALFSTLPACGHKGSTEGSQDQAQTSGAGATAPTAGLAHSQRLALEAEVECADGGQCPESTGMVTAAHEGGVDQCTGSLIGPDLVMTSSRCVPVDLRSSNADCGSRIRFLLPATAGIAAQDSSCAQVLVQSPDDAHAFIRLKAAISGRHPLDLSRAGLGDGDKVSIPVVDASSGNKPLGVIRVLNCTAYQKTMALPRFRSASSPVVALGGGDCNISSTHLGAPVLDDRGVVRAVIKSGFTESDIHENRRLFGELLDGADVANFAFASNLACIRTPTENAHRKLPDACTGDARFSVPRDPFERAITLEVRSAAQAEIYQRISKWRNDPAQKFRWEVPAPGVKRDQRIQPVLSCIQNSDQWLKDYRHWYISGGYNSDAQIALSLPRFQVGFRMNSLLRTSGDVRDSDSLAVMLQFSPREIADKGQSTVTLREKATGAAVGSPVVLKKCAD
jgi:hypothetical protein